MDAGEINSAAGLVRADAKTKTEEHCVGSGGGLNDLAQEPPPEGRPSSKSTKLIPGVSARPPKYSAQPATLALNRRRLSRLLQKLARAHRWKEASGVLSVLLKGTPRGTSLREDRRNFLVAMEIERTFGSKEERYELKIKKIHDAWMKRLSWLKKGSKKKWLLELERALFYLERGNVEQAHIITKILVEDKDARCDPAVNLMHGLLSYHLWYSSLPIDMQIKDFHVLMTSDKEEMSRSLNEETGTFESLNEHHAINVEDADNKFSSQCMSESSVNNNKNTLINHKGEVSRRKSNGAYVTHDFYQSGSENNEGGDMTSNRCFGFDKNSIFLAPGLGKSLLPIHLMHQHEDLEKIIESYMSNINETYEDAVRHLRVALHSTPPLMAALVPFVQILLLGDRVKEALEELKSACLTSSTALPFRLRATLLECFHCNQAVDISCCYEDALRRDPTCIYSVEKLIKLHKNGNYSSLQLLEMLALHLDSVDGSLAIWEELVNLCRSLVAETYVYEDCISSNVKGCSTSIRPSINIFGEGYARESWKVRCQWWMSRHFGKKAYLLETQRGDRKLIACKAACASHLYGPEFEYVKAALSTLGEERAKEEIRFLRSHMKNPARILQLLEGTCLSSR